MCYNRAEAACWPGKKCHTVNSDTGQTLDLLSDVKKEKQAISAP